MSHHPADRSYRALFSVPALGRILLGGTIARTAQAMVAVTLVLFTLAHYGSPVLAGIVTFASIFPGLIVSPLAGALLDRHGRARLIALDYLLCAGSFGLIAGLAMLDALPAWLLVLIATVSSITGIFSHTGLRSLFPIIVPAHLWERVNAVDSNAYLLAILFGPPAAGALVQVFGGPAALLVIAVIFALAALTLVGMPDPQTETATSGSIFVDAWQGLRYAWRHPVLRALGFSITTLNLAHGAIALIIPVVVLQRLGGTPAMVGLVFAVQGVAGMAAALVVGRWRTAGRERQMIVRPMAGTALALLLLLLPVSLPVVVVCFALVGFLNGPIDVAMFTLRQRRTDPAWMGRAFAVSMAFNYLGFPVGSFAAGLLVEGWLELAVVLAIVSAAVAALLAWAMLPGESDRETAAETTAEAAPEPAPSWRPESPEADAGP